MENRYVDQRESGYYVTGTRISLDSVVHAFRRDESRRKHRALYAKLEAARRSMQSSRA